MAWFWGDKNWRSDEDFSGFLRGGAQVPYVQAEVLFATMVRSYSKVAARSIIIYDFIYC